MEEVHGIDSNEKMLNELPHTGSGIVLFFLYGSLNDYSLKYKEQAETAKLIS